MLIPVFVGLALPLALTACPGGADLEDPDRFIYGVSGAGGSGGSTAGTGGTAGTAGTTAGSAGSAGKTWMYTPPACDYQAALASGCIRPGCHNAATAIADLDLATAGVENRLIDVTAMHPDISCPNPDGGAFPVPCVPPTCPMGNKLVDTQNPANSWMLKKIMGASEISECGDPMPLAPGTLTAAQKDCMIAWINAMAAAQ